MLAQVLCKILYTNQTINSKQTQLNLNKQNLSKSAQIYKENETERWIIAPGDVQE